MRRYHLALPIALSAFVCVAYFAVASLTQASAAPDAKLRLSGGSFAAGIGFSWGSGTLTYKGKDYPVKVNGLSIGKIGITGASAVGEVYNLKDLRDFDGNYNAFGAGATLAGGVSSVTLKNEHAVKVHLRSNNKGVDLTLGGGGVSMKLKK